MDKKGKYVVLVSGEGEKFTVEKKIAQRSLLLKNYLNDMHESSLDDEDEEQDEDEDETMRL